MTEKELAVPSKIIFSCYAEQVSICRAFCYLRNKTWEHQRLPFKCFCNDYRLKKLFNRILVERDNQCYHFVIIVNNLTYMKI